MCCRRGGDKKVERKEDKDGEIICVFLFLLTSWISVCAFLLRLHNDCHVIVEFLFILILVGNGFYLEIY
jgi:hypothetical protein